MINSRSIDDLDPAFKLVVLEWLKECKASDLDILIVSTYRDVEYQNYLYSFGRTRKGKICTNAKGGESNHQKRIALDFCVMDGKTCDWDNVAGFTKAGLIAERLCLNWAGRWNGKLKEMGHIEGHLIGG